LRAVENNGNEKITLYETICGPPLSSWKLPETGFLKVSLPELENYQRYWLEIWYGSSI
jgi:hypothetical protein